MKSETVVSFVSAQPGAIDCTSNLQSMVVPNNWPGVLIVFQAFQRMKDQFFKVSTDNFSLPLLALQRLDHFLLGKPAYLTVSRFAHLLIKPNISFGSSQVSALYNHMNACLRLTAV